MAAIMLPPHDQAPLMLTLKIAQIVLCMQVKMKMIANIQKTALLFALCLEAGVVIFPHLFYSHFVPAMSLNWKINSTLHLR